MVKPSSSCHVPTVSVPPSVSSSDQTTWYDYTLSNVHLLYVPLNTVCKPPVAEMCLWNDSIYVYRCESILDTAILTLLTICETSR